MNNPRKVLFPLLWVLCGFMLGLLAFRSPQPNQQDIGFLQGMIAHHNQAVDMAIRLHERLTALNQRSPLQITLKAISFDIQSGQTNQVGQMMGWLHQYGQPVTGEPMDPSHMGMATPEDVKSLSTLPLNDAQNKFLGLMIRHHQGGVKMAQAAVSTARLPVVRNLAQKIIQAQQNEIEELTRLLKQQGGEVPTSPQDATPGMHHQQDNP
ncbi:DUF305 domain-containing protein [Deinococcus cellulosilyticus]|uniref:DUF305 domain-containing protein n=2 Tax=Deinococcus cellulosilyticus TaxID=401558 RepID=A0A511N197_DEIC1|nr:DUF305 domain-containing protein [Deinococcus cellulosilyticus]GEM46632.1 DUF305 domain-containing protein [Deinococcus cellulosilyticus NBRC 106333 = KACC 11606]